MQNVKVCLDFIFDIVQSCQVQQAFQTASVQGFSLLTSTTDDQFTLSPVLTLISSFFFSQTHFFGLWFVGKNQQARWVELEKPLRKQLDKFSVDPMLYFGVMFYVPNVSCLNQSVTR